MNNLIPFEPKKNSQAPQNVESQNLASLKAQAGLVEVIKNTSSDFPIVICKGTGYLHHHANEFLILRAKHKEFFQKESDKDKSARRWVTPSKGTLSNYADHIRYWLNICAHLNESYLQVDEGFFEDVLETMRDDRIAESSIRQYVGTWRQFYDYLHFSHIDCNMILPEKLKGRREKSESDNKSDLLNYAKKDSSIEYDFDPLIDEKRLKKTSDYSSQVLTTAQMRELINELRKIDVVYGVLAKVQFDTLMRIEEVLTYVPYEKNSLNPNFMNWGQLHLLGKDSQPLNFIGKGEKSRTLDLDIETLALIEEKYITAKPDSSDITLYNSRKHLFLTKFLPSYDGKKSKYTPSSDVLWLSEEGRPVSKYMYQEAFRSAVKELRRKGAIEDSLRVRPHAMRHTGATLRLVKYHQESGVEIELHNDGAIHQFLKDLLGHEKMETTHRYIRTVTKLKIGYLAKKTITRNEDVWADEIKNNPALRKGIEAIKNPPLI